MLFETLVNPGRPIPSMVTSLTGITEAMVRAAPRFEDIAGQVLDALGGRIFVAHNARFDWRFVSSEIHRARDHRLYGSRLCTVRLSKRLVPVLLSRSLDAVSHHFGVENRARHRAGGDALATAELLYRLLRLAREDGARTLQDLHAMQGPRPRKRSSGRPTARPTDFIY